MIISCKRIHCKRKICEKDVIFNVFLHFQNRKYYFFKILFTKITKFTKTIEIIEPLRQDGIHNKCALKYVS